MPAPAPPIDRRRLIQRHHVVLDGIDAAAVLSVGNGEFAFNADATGLQTFPGRWQAPLATLAQWAWHSEPNPQGHTLEDAMQPHRFGDRNVLLPSAGWPAQPDHAAAAWLERNPHKFNLARIGLHLRHSDGRPPVLEDLHRAHQELRLWEGTLHSRFMFDAQPIELWTRVHPQRDMLCITLRAGPALAGRIGIEIDLQAPLRSAGPGSTPPAARRDHVERLRLESRRIGWRRQLDDSSYHVTVESDSGLRHVAQEGGGTLFPAEGGAAIWSLGIAFDTAAPLAPLPLAAEAARAVHAHWQAHWQRGGMVDFSACADARAAELERRLVLSQYLMAVHAAGSLPPQETGLAELSWHGKFHIEMHWWHGAHFALWGRGQLLERSMGWYLDHLPQARERAQAQGLAGARWPKMVGPEGRESPGAINPFIVWQQPHPIHLAELLHRDAERPEDVLQRFATMVIETAHCIATLVQRRGGNAPLQYELGPPVMPVQEIHAAAHTFNPTFELAYFHWGLKTAQQWRERLGLEREPLWDEVADHLAPLPQRDGLYLVAESQPELWQRAACDECRDRGEPLTLDDLLHNRCPNVDHPSFAGAFGWLPGHRVDADAMRRTLHKVRDDWNLSKVWGWDFGMLAMSAARLGEPALALDFLLHPSVANRWGVDGRVPWKAINAYLPANGALLSAVAMMAVGWDGAAGPAPGFPADGRWAVRAEGLRPLP